MMDLPFADWLPHQRWYAGRHRTISTVEPTAVTPLRDDLDHVVLAVTYADDSEERYQVLVGWDHAPVDEFEAVATIGSDHGRTGYDALFDEQAVQQLLTLISSDARVGALRFIPEPDVTLPVDAPARVVDTEQSNTSVI